MRNSLLNETPNTIGYVDLLSAQAAHIGDRRNAPHTRLRIQIVTAQLLQDTSYDKLSIGRICEKVNLTRPGFYLHYRNKEELVLDALKGLVKTEAQLMPSLMDCANLREAIFRICDWYFRFHVLADGLFSAMIAMRRSVPEAEELQKQRSNNLHEAASYQLKRFDRYCDIEPDWATFAVDATARAMGVTARSMNKQAGPRPMRYTHDVGRLVDLFSRMMYSTLLSETPPLEEPTQ